MEEAISQAQDKWSYGLFRNDALVAPESARSSLEVGDKEGVQIRVQGVRASLFVRGEPVKLAPYLVYATPNTAGEIPVRHYEGWIAGYRFGIFHYDADTDIELIEPDGTAWWGRCRYQDEWE